MASSIEDVAREAGVSIATVSRALRGLPNVAPTTRQRVLAVAESLHYVASPHAARLATRRSMTVALVVPDLGQWYYAQIAAGVEAVLATRGYESLLYALPTEEQQRSFIDSRTWRKRVDGIVIVDLAVGEDVQRALLETDTVAVVVGQGPAGLPRIHIENALAAQRAVEYLIDLGHERIGLISGDPPDSDDRYESPRLRRVGYLEAHGLRDLAVDVHLDVPGLFSAAGGAEAMQRLLRLDSPPTAVFAMSDEMAIGALSAARAAGLSVPGQMSIVGFDDHDLSLYVGLTTVRQNVLSQGERAARMLLAKLAGEAIPDEVVAPTELVVRQTTGPPEHLQAERRRDRER